MKWTTEINQLLGIAYPLIQAPMFGVSTPEMAAAAAQAGALGSLALGDLPAAQCRELIRKTRALSDQAFSVNIFVHHIPECTDELKARYTQTKIFIEELARQHKLELDLPPVDTLVVTGYREQVDLLLEEQCKIVSFTFGNLDAASILKFKEQGTLLIGTCTSVAEALILEASGIDLICVQGWEAGGHRGSFEADNIPEIGGLSLLAQVYDQVKVPLIYAGGIYDAKTACAASSLGAQALQVGSLLLGAQESNLQAFEKAHLSKAREADIILTKSFSGRYARGLRNLFTEALAQSGLTLPYPYQNKLTAALRQAAKENEQTDFVSIWAGQSLAAYREGTTTAILNALINDIENYSWNP
ncbi:MAG: tungsten formylmethanofuran dehydrogenase [Bacteroidetes bacterium 43-16]|nr:MAG: tungsten formylmethanofuran dehydrogenase [Bacteroidetes bacterium 43-16]